MQKEGGQGDGRKANNNWDGEEGRQIHFNYCTGWTKNSNKP